MYYRGSHGAPFTGRPIAGGLNAQPPFLRASCIDIGNDDPDAPRRQIVVPAPGANPTFDGVFCLAVTSARFDQTVLVVCMAEQLLTKWQRKLQERAKPVDGLELLDGHDAWSVDWRAFFCRKSYDVAVLHGIRSALQDQSLPLSYARRLVDAVTASLIVLA